MYAHFDRTLAIIRLVHALRIYDCLLNVVKITIYLMYYCICAYRDVEV